MVQIHDKNMLSSKKNTNTKVSKSFNIDNVNKIIAESPKLLLKLFTYLTVNRFARFIRNLIISVIILTVTTYLSPKVAYWLSWLLPPVNEEIQLLQSTIVDLQAKINQLHVNEVESTELKKTIANVLEDKSLKSSSNEVESISIKKVAIVAGKVAVVVVAGFACVYTGKLCFEYIFALSNNFNNTQAAERAEKIAELATNLSKNQMAAIKAGQQILTQEITGMRNDTALKDTIDRLNKL